jgi:hypothetical protein
MAEPDPMSPQELAAMYFAPSAEQGPEAAPVCVLCKKNRIESQWRQESSGVCVECEHRQRGWQPDPGPVATRARRPQLMPAAVRTHVDYERRAYQQQLGQLAAEPRYQVPPGYYPTSYVNERAWKEWTKGMIFGICMGVLASALVGLLKRRRARLA